MWVPVPLHVACTWRLLLQCPYSVSSPAVTVVNEDAQPRQYLMCGQTAQVKLKNVVPHDIGDPGERCSQACFQTEQLHSCSHIFLRVVNSQDVEEKVAYVEHTCFLGVRSLGDLG